MSRSSHNIYYITYCFTNSIYLLGVGQLAKVCYLIHKIAFLNASVSIEHRKGYRKIKKAKLRLAPARLFLFSLHSNIRLHICTLFQTLQVRYLLEPKTARKLVLPLTDFQHTSHEIATGSNLIDLLIKKRNVALFFCVGKSPNESVDSIRKTKCYIVIRVGNSTKHCDGKHVFMSICLLFLHY